MTRDRDEVQQMAQQPQVDEPGVVDRIKLGLAVAGAILLVILLIQNLDTATIKFLFWSWDMPLIFALFASALLGAITWGIAGFFRGRARESRIRAEIRAERAKK